MEFSLLWFEGEGWFLSYHCFDKYIKVAFFRGAKLKPMPPVESKSQDTRYFHIHEQDDVDEAQLADWIRQASLLPGEKCSFERRPKRALGGGISWQTIMRLQSLSMGGLPS